MQRLTEQAIENRRFPGIGFIYDSSPGARESVEVAEGVWWFQLPIGSRLETVNCYILDDGDGWALVDTGSNEGNAAEQLESIFSLPTFSSKPLRRVIVTHFHPDHIGLAGVMVRASVKFEASEACWNAARSLWADQPARPRPEHVAFLQRAGLAGSDLVLFKRRRPSTYADRVAQLPDECKLIREGEELAIGKQKWKVRMGNGHADEHVTLWSEDNVAIVGDQILPAVAPNLSVHFTHPESDTVGDWLASCRRFSQLANDNTICLPGHNRPFVGAPHRCRLMIRNCESVIKRLLKYLSKPATAVDCMPTIYQRPLEKGERMLLIGETMGYLNHLHQLGLVERRLSKAQQYLWCRK